MSVQIFNTLTRQKEPFESIEPGKVRMYVCGITAYNYFHVGNARVFLVFDVVRRYLMWRGYDVRYVQNFTDIDDKILRRATSEGSTMQEVADRFIAAYFEDADRLNILRADSYPRATHTIDGIQRLIHELEQQNYAYPADGDVYYSVGKFSGYGKLSGRRLDDLQAGASGRVEVDEDDLKKKDPFDFALWKAAKPGEPAWESPWGAGRPGWHIECSAMVRQELGESIDIHAGGIDLTFPHHENEIAQSEAVTGKPLAHYWMHNGFVNMDGEKMSKSIGNIRLTRDLLAHYDPMALRLFILQAQYRKPIDFTAESLAAAESGWHTIKEALRAGARFSMLPQWSTEANVELDTEIVDRFNAAMDDDFNTPIALSVLFELAKDLRHEENLLFHQGETNNSTEQIQKRWQTLEILANVLGLTNLPLKPLVGQPLLEKVRTSQPPRKELAKFCGYYTLEANKAHVTRNDLENFYAALPESKQIKSSNQSVKSLTEAELDRQIDQKILGVLPSIADYEYTNELTDADIEALIEQRLAARKAKNFAEADRIRNELQAQGITLIDDKGGITRWHRS